MEKYTGDCWWVACPKCGVQYLSSIEKEPEPYQRCVRCLRAELDTALLRASEEK